MPAMQTQPLVQRSASFNASSTVPLKITILDESGKECRRSFGGSSPYSVKASKSLSNCSLISKIVSKGDGTRNIISHLVPATMTYGPSHSSDGMSSNGKNGGTFSNGDGADKFRDYYV